MRAYQKCKRQFVSVRTLRLTVSLGAVGLAACSVVGPTSIDQGRMRYNEVIHDTYVQQTLLNLVRVHNNESPLFMDVTEVDAATTAGATVAGGPSAIGASPNYKSGSAGTITGTLGFVTGGAQYVESPTVRYQPLLGQPLVAQIQTPLSPEDFAKLLNAQWPLAAVLTLGTVGMTPGFAQKYAAIDAIVDLDHYGAVVFAATSSMDDASGKGNKMRLSDNTKVISVVVNNAATEKKKDALTFYRTDGVRAKNGSGFIDASYLKCERSNGYVPAGTYAAGSSNRAEEEHAKAIVRALWNRLENIYGQDPREGIVLSASSGRGRPPLLVTRSAISIMQEAAILPDQPRPIIEFVQDPQQIQNAIAKYNSNDDDCKENFYMVGWLKDDQSPYSNNYSTTLFPEKSIYSDKDYRDELSLAHERRYMLVAETDAPPPPDVYVSIEHRGKWYYILSNDTVSQRALMLLTQFNTILATPPASPPLTPSISVGAR
jgi:hypothetical protein